MQVTGAGKANAGNVAVNGDLAATGAASGPGGLLNTEKDQKEASTEAKFGEVLQKIQSKYGAKPEKAREIKKTLGKDDFLRIMITQLKNQDPTKPFNAEQMAAQMAQFTSVEQLQNINQNLGKMQNQYQPLERLAMTNMIGKTVTIDRERFQHLQDQTESLSFVLPKDAAECRVLLISDAGETVLDKQMGQQKAGEVTLGWDGKQKNSLPAKAGTYMLRVEAKGDNGQTIETNPMAQARVIGVSFEGSEPAFLVGDAKHQDKITMKQIVKIDDIGQAGGGGIMPLQQAPAKPNFIAFQKGVGSGGLDEQQASPEIAAALAKFQSEQEAAKAAPARPTEAPRAPAEPPRAPAEAAKPMAPPRPEERGFPNGLHDDEAPTPPAAGEPRGAGYNPQKGGRQQ
jgi:flagellar basal-body rod modification protein FlgD